MLRSQGIGTPGNFQVFLPACFRQSQVNMYKTSILGSPMSAIVQSPRPYISNRRRSMRQRVHAPAYASFAGASRNEMLDLYEVLDISEDGVALQCPSPKEINQQVELCLDLAESSEQLSTTASVVWSNSAGRVGLKFPDLPEPARRRLREWLFLNAMAGAANAAMASSVASSTPAELPALSVPSGGGRPAPSPRPSPPLPRGAVASRSSPRRRSKGRSRPP